MPGIILFQPRAGFYDLLVKNIPLGLLSISRYLHLEYGITIIDQRASDWKNKLLNALRNNPICFGVTCTTGKQIRFALEVTKFAKSVTNIPIVFGEIHPSLMPRQTLKNENIDIVVEGEGEITFRDLVRALDGQIRLNSVANIWYKKDGEIKHTFSNNRFLDLDALPPLPYQLVNMSDYANFSLQNFGDVFFLETGRGCPYRCIYCYNSSFNNKRRMVSAEKIIQEIKYLKKFTELDGITFVDDSFFVNKERIKRLLELFKKENPKIKWNCEAGLNDIKEMDEMTLKELESSGLNWLAIGVESGSPRILRLINLKNA